MGIVIRQSIKSTIITYVGIVIGTINLLWLSARFLPPEYIGLSRVIVDASILFVSFAQIGVVHISDRFFPYFRDESQKHKGFFFFLLIYPLIGYLIFVLFFKAFENSIVDYYHAKSPIISKYLFWILPITFFIIYQNVVEAYCKTHFRIAIPALVREVFLRLANALIIILFAFNFVTFNQFLLLLALSYGVAVLILLFYVKRLNKLFIKPDFSFFDKALLNQMISYGLYIVLGGVGTILVTKIDILMLPAYTGLDYTAIYVIASFFATIIEVPRRSLIQISTPILTQAWKNNDLKKIDELYEKTSINQLIIGGYLLLGIVCNIDAIFYILPNADIYSQGKYVVIILAISKIIDMSVGINAEIIGYSKYYKFTLLSMLLLSFMTIISNYYLIPILGINGAAIGTGGSILIFTFIKVLFVWLKFRLQPFRLNSLIPFSLITVFLGIFLTTSNDFTSYSQALLSIIIRGTLITVSFGGIIYFFKVSEDINKIIHSFLNIKK